MSFIDQATASRIIHEGHYRDETAYVVSYLNQWGGTSWATLGWRDDPLRYHRSPACMNVRLEWANPAAKPFPEVTS